MIRNDGLSLVGEWVHPSQREARAPKTAVLYGREWSAADAAYAEVLASDESIPTADLERLWATNRPSVRVTLPSLANGSPVTEIGGSERLKTPEPEESKTPEDDEERLKTLRRERNARFYARKKQASDA
jgi:hypothetical protein